MRFLQEAKKWIGEITEIFLLLIALGITIEILFGVENTLPFIGEVVPNMTAMIGDLGDNGLVGLIALGIIFFLFHRKQAVHQHHQG
ncbi:MAG: hypothetical protein GY774_14885 [Planctomycetes bacterium]|nr:hypothetical protein [Planctomycetota bacterium]